MAGGGSGHEDQKLPKVVCTLSISRHQHLNWLQTGYGQPHNHLQFTLSLPLQQAGGDYDGYLSRKKRKQQAQQDRRTAGPVQQGGGGVQRLEKKIGAMSI